MPKSRIEGGAPLFSPCWIHPTPDTIKKGEAEVVNEFEKVLTDVRSGLSEPNSPALLLLDKAPQHTSTLSLQAFNCSTLYVPAKMTHVFQPCDHYIIANMKKNFDRTWRKWVQGVYADATTSIEECTARILTTSIPVLRTLKYHQLSVALSSLTPSTILKSFGVTGILRAVYGNTNYEVIYDSLIQTLSAEELSEAQKVSTVIVGDSENGDMNEPINTLATPTDTIHENVDTDHRGEALDYVLVTKMGRPPKETRVSYHSAEERKRMHRRRLHKKRVAHNNYQWFSRRRIDSVD